eukprot:scaffold9926_cov117-Isochrysis_galbana.AAC.3
MASLTRVGAQLRELRTVRAVSAIAIASLHLHQSGSLSVSASPVQGMVNLARRAWVSLRPTGQREGLGLGVCNKLIRTIRWCIWCASVSCVRDCRIRRTPCGEVEMRSAPYRGRRRSPCGTRQLPLVSPQNVTVVV